MRSDEKLFTSCDNTRMMSNGFGSTLFDNIYPVFGPEECNALSRLYETEIVQYHLETLKLVWIFNIQYMQTPQNVYIIFLSSHSLKILRFRWIYSWWKTLLD